ncbi:hypothetical protein OIU79_029370 [Salix purpurea]|uniref:Uncharacterized protein n=1 Tax=Salix purpurea TaxID=77065 RepID=A0A9Q0VIL2_SALPP|nr:hypothetical protein OIU79_029370 [Salix purpurea]
MGLDRRGGRVAEVAGRGNERKIMWVVMGAVVGRREGDGGHEAAGVGRPWEKEE